MQVEIKSVNKTSSSFQGKTTIKKAVETSQGSFNVSEKNKAFGFIPEGFVGIADIDFGDMNGRKYIKHFKPVSKGNTTQTPQKSHQEVIKPINGAFKKDPAGIKLEVWKRQHCSWIGCLQCAITFYKDNTSKTSQDVILVANNFYDALCKEVDKKKEEVKQETEQTEPKQQEPAELESKDIKDVPF